MPLDPSIQPLVDVINAAAAEGPPLSEQTPEMRRAAYHALLEAVPPGPAMASVAHQSAPGPGGDVPMRLYRPTSNRPTGVLVYFHGGGWCIGDLDTHDGVCRRLAADSGAMVVSVDYRLAPEHAFPAAVDDCWAALRWVWSHRQALAEDPEAGVVIAGDSAGGNLAAVMAITARDRDDVGVRPKAQLLVYPAVDLRMEGYPSLVENGEGLVLTAESMQWFRANYLASAADADDWRASPILAADLSGLAPAVIITADHDPLRDEGKAYADALTAAGVPVEHTVYDGMVHIFFQLDPAIEATGRALTQVADATRRYLVP